MITAPAQSSLRVRKPALALGLVAIVALAILGWFRVGLLDLPRVSSSITPESAGLSDLEALARLDAYIRPNLLKEELTSEDLPVSIRSAARTMATARNSLNTGDYEGGLAMMQGVIEEFPDNLVFSNSYRMGVMEAKRIELRQAAESGHLSTDFSPYLEDQPIGFLTVLAERHPSRETRLTLALAWVDHMLLFPALEIKAPSSVESVNILTDLLEAGNGDYVPALFARGLNHLHRPARLVWPESARTPPDAAARDIARCVAIGRTLRLGSNRLQARMAMALGDAYVKAGRYEVARSWWQIAQNLSPGDEFVTSSARRRFGWSDGEMIDRLEETLDEARSGAGAPMTDLAIMWRP